MASNVLCLQHAHIVVPLSSPIIYVEYVVIIKTAFIRNSLKLLKTKEEKRRSAKGLKFYV